MRGVTEYDKLFDRAYSWMWKFSTGQATNWKQCYRGAKHFSRFVLSEIQRERELIALGETALARRGLCASHSIRNTWVWNVIEDCSQLRSPLPPEMLQVLYHVLECNHFSAHPENAELVKKRRTFLNLLSSNSNVPVRATARKLGVDPATVSRWKKNLPLDIDSFDQDAYSEVRRLTHIDEFLERSARALRR